MTYIVKFPVPDEEPAISITENSRLTFGKHGPTKRKSGKKLSECPKTYLEWMAQNLLDTDFHVWAIAAKQFLETRTAEDAPVEDLEQQANDFLRDAGFNPRTM